MTRRRIPARPAQRRIGVTDHALVRWLERSGALDVAAMRAALAGSLDRAMAAAGQLGQEQFLILADGLVYVVKDRTLITVLPEDGRHGRIHARLHEAEPGG